MQQEKLNSRYKIGVVCFSATLVISLIASLMVEYELMTTTSRLYDFFNILAGVSLALFIWNGLGLWVAFFEPVRHSYRAEIVFVYVASFVVSGYWAYRAFRKKNIGKT